jgi:hypothetical protein
MNIMKHILIIFLFCSIYPTFTYCGEADFKEQILLVGKWGNKDGEFGSENLGKTETGHSLDFTIYNRSIYMFDTMNNRIQVFDMNGKLINKISLRFDWLKQGITWQFTILKDNLFALIAEPPYYSVMNIYNIYKISASGDLLKKFGDKQINKEKGESFSRIIANEITNELYCYIENSSRIAVYDFEGNFVKYIFDMKNGRQILIDDHGQLNKNAPNYCSWLDRKGNCYKIWSKSSAKTGFVLTTQIQIFPPNSKTKDIITHELSGDVKYVRDGAEHFIGYKGNFDERSFVDLDGTIYHVIALADGVILRRLTWKFQ